jgi:predicted alpha-1,2-mannosidase
MRFIPIFFLACFLTASAGLHAEDLTRYVNPFIGTKPGAPDYIINNSNGNVFPGAVWPNGMVQFSPDTPKGNAGGYLFTATQIKGFSLTHFSGRGIACWMDFPIMPTVGPVSGRGRKFSRFSHAHETAAPGYYRVKLEDSSVTAELTATAHTGFARFSFPSSGQPILQIDTQGDASSAKGGALQFPSDEAVSGETTGQGGGGRGITYKLYFYAQFDQPIRRRQVWKKDFGADLFFDPASDNVVRMKVGISFVSTEGAKANLEAENPGWDFDAVRQKAASAWNERLSQIRVEGGSLDQRTVFYTSLYHACVHPNIFSDADGRYLGFDQKIHQMPHGHAQYENFSAWDNYRSEMPLVAILWPRQAADMMQSLVNMAEEDRSVRPRGGGLPRWEQANQNSGGMEGDDQDLVIASVYALGVRDFEVKRAFEAMERGASVIGTTSGGCLVRPGLSDWLKRGYVPRQGSLNLEYANDDFAIAQLALALGDEEKYQAYLKRSENWKNIFDSRRGDGGNFVPRTLFGSFTLEYPLYCGVFCGFDESDSVQYTWLLPFSYPELFELLGGTEKVLQRLDAHFFDKTGRERLNEGPDSPYAFLGNEPESAAPYAYLFAGAPEKTFQVLRAMIEQWYRNAPDGMPGNDDGGAMGSWVVWAMMGLRPVVSGTQQVALTGPMFDSVVLALPGGKSLHVHAARKSPPAAVLDKVTLNGDLLSGKQVLWSRLAQGGELLFHYR